MDHLLAGGALSSLPLSERPETQKDRPIRGASSGRSGYPTRITRAEGPLEQDKQQSELSTDASATCTSGQGHYPKRHNISRPKHYSEYKFELGSSLSGNNVAD